VKEGRAILQTGSSSVLTDACEAGAMNTDKLRPRYRGQRDHVRVYRQDLLAKLVTEGLELELRANAVQLHPIRKGPTV
jgi:hypothetical protein